MSVLLQVLSVLRTIFRRIGAGVRWLARQAFRQRSLGVSEIPQLVRLLDLHALTVAAHLTLFAALIVARGSIPPWAWFGSALIALALSSMAVWRSSRLLIGLLIVAQLLGAGAAAYWNWRLLPLLFALAVAQHAALAVVWLRNGARMPALGRATAYGLLLGVFTGGAGLLLGIFAAGLPLWIASILFAIAAVLSVRVPDPGRPKPPPPPQLKQLPRQAQAAPEKDGFAVYRPSSLDESS